MAASLNDSKIDWHSENKLEFEQHLEIQKLQYELEAEKAKSLRILTALKKLVDEGGKDGNISEKDAISLLNPPQDNSPKGMPLPPKEPFN